MVLWSGATQGGGLLFAATQGEAWAVLWSAAVGPMSRFRGQIAAAQETEGLILNKFPLK